MKKNAISKLLILVFMLNIYSQSVQAITNNYPVSSFKNDKSFTKSNIMSNYEKNKHKKNFKSDEILVKVKNSASDSSIELSEKKHNIKSKKHLNKNLDVVKFDDTKYSMDEMLLSLNQDLNIEYAEPNYISNITSIPEDEPYFGDLWGLNNTITQGLDINVEAAWKISTGNPEIIVGVLDTGVNYNHEDLQNNIWVNDKEIPRNGIDDDANGFVDDYKGWDFANSDNDPNDDNNHGTHISGIIAAESNGIGTVGVAPNVKIMALKTGDSQGASYNSDILKAIQYGSSKGVKIFNCSFGSSDFSQAEYDAMKSTDALFICAAGNGNGLDNDSYIKNYPSSFDLDNIISVASIDKYGNLSSFSNYGATSVDIAAPGSSILSTISNGYGYKSGTSMATPYITGISALVLSADMNLSPIEIRNCILKSAHILTQLENKVATGGIADAFAAMIIAKYYIPTDVDNNGITDLKDLELASLGYNLQSGDLNYNSTLDINKDGIVDIYDLVDIAKEMQ